MVIRDTHEKMIAVVLSFSEEYVCSPFIVEIKVLCRALNFCVKISLHDVTFEGDAKKVVDEIQNSENWSSHGRLIIEDVKKLVRS